MASQESQARQIQLRCLMRFISSVRQALIPFAVCAIWVGFGQLAMGQQNWNPEPAKASLMLISAHPDDEGIFFGGAIPYYSTVAPVPMVHICMTPDLNAGQESYRQGELLNADWAYGLRNQPIFAGFKDFYDAGTPPDVNGNRHLCRVERCHR